jgi:AraC-like DNA-binding protein
MDHSRYDELRPAPDLQADVACTWIGRIGASGVPYTDRVLPDGCVDIIWNGSELFVAGPDTGPVPFVPQPDTVFVGIRFRTGRAAPALGCPASALRDQRADLADLWGTGPTRALAERLAGTPGAHAAVRLLESAVRSRLVDAAPPDRVIEGLVAALSARPAPAPGLVSALASRLGVTERSLHRRCSSAVGYGPKTLDRVLRFRRALELGATGSATNLGALALTAGYADQAHFTRECRRLAGQTPSELFKTDR